MRTQRIIDEQLRLMRKQLDVLRSLDGEHGSPGPATDQAFASIARGTTATSDAVLTRISTETPEVADTERLSDLPDVKRVPLTDVQRDVWINCQLSDAGSAAYDLVATLELAGDLDVVAMRGAVRRLVQRHEALRTTFDAAGDHQLVHRDADVELRVVDLSDVPEPERSARSAALREAEHSIRYDLVEGPLFRATLVRSGPTDHALVLSGHHLICDGSSLGIMQRELSILYSSLVRGDEASLDEATPYSDYVAWRTEQGEASEAHWLGLYAEPPSQLDLPSDHARSPVRSFDYDSVAVDLGEDLLAAVRGLSVATGVTPFIVLLAAWEILLHRLSGQAEFSSGIYVAGQQSMGVRDLVGLCASLLPLRVRVAPGEPLRDYLSRSKQRTYQAFDHQDYAVGRLASALHLPRDASRPMLVSSVITLETPTPGIDFDGLDATEALTPRRFGAFDLEAYLTETHEGLTVDLQYSTALLEATTVRRWLGHYVQLLREMTAHPESSVSDLRVLGDEERREILTRWNDAEAPIPDLSTHEHIEREAARHPHRVAIEGTAGPITYGELNARANRLARHLRGLGVEAERLVGIYVARSPDMVAAMLGVLKAGGAFVPLDPIFPRERVEAIAADTGLHAIITERPLGDGLSADDAVVVLLDDDAATIAQHDDSDLGIVPGPTDLAYIISTSGSTGTPKGVEIEHRSLANQLAGMRQQPGLAPGDVLLSVTTMSFDPFLLEAFLPLMVGARIVLADARQAADAMWIRDRLDKGDISVMQATPATWQMLLDAGWSGTPGLKILCGGEALSQELAVAVASRVDSLWNVYGTTEATIWQSSSRVGQDGGLIPIGRSIANLEFHVLDESLQPQPVGVIGGLYIGGVGLARGYRNRPELTAVRFIYHSFDGEPPRRLYKTGDLARRHPNGDIEFLGRDDFQVKVRGFRIELEEIETVLARHHGVKETAVAARPGPDGTKRLVAYVVPANGHRTSVSDLRMYLREFLPDYMIPSAFLELEAMPLSSNLKVDRARLPDPDGLRPDLANELVKPRTEIETELVRLWKRLLGLEQVGVEDNFFELGGDSLLALRCIIGANGIGIALAPDAIFRYQTIAELAVAATNAATANVAEQGVVTGPVPLTPAQLRFLTERHTPDANHWNISTLVEAERLSPEALRVATDDLVRHHDALRLRLWQEDGQWRQEIVAPSDTSAFQSHDLSSLSAAEQVAAIERISTEMQAGFDLGGGSLLKVAHFDGGSQAPDRVFLTIHHFAVDGMSWGVFCEDFERAYRQADQGEVVALPHKTTSIKAWASQLERLAQSPRVASATSTWLGLGWNEVASVPLDLESGPDANTNGSAAKVEYTFEPDESHRLLAGHARPEHVILSALGSCLSDWTSSRTVLIDVLGHGRDAAFDGVNLSRTLGFTLCYDPLVLSHPTWEATPQMIDAIAEQMASGPEGFGFELLRFLAADRELRDRLTALPRADVLFNFAGTPASFSEAAPWSRSTIDTGPDESPRGLRQYPLAVRATLAPSLRLTFVYSTNLHRRATIETRLTEVVATIRELLRDSPQPS